MRRQRQPTTWNPVTPQVHGLVRPVGLDPFGLDGPTKGQARGPLWVWTSHGHYVPIGTPRDLVEQWIMERAVRLPPMGAVTGWAACRLHGAAYFDGLADDGRAWLPVPLAIGPHRSLAASPTVVVTNHVLLPRDRTTVYDIPTVIPVRAVYDAVRLAPDLHAAVRAIDMAAAAGLCSLSQLRQYAALQPQEAAKVLRAASLASEYALSPPETDVRLVCELDLGLQGLEVNAHIHDRDGRVVAQADLLDPEAGLVIEVDGLHHQRPHQASADLARSDALLRLGLEVARVAARDSRRRSLVAQRVRLVRSRCRFEPVSERAWWFSRPHVDFDARRRWGGETAGGRGA
ncbi:hypothetical protein [Nocardioides aequoreus]|uniref:hypothetical protein n=1 Tax=Nocardioides aequoreus TaxID=397278 RepID=UPI0012F63470|nr:hypothetical protein [Nocardioides aequoreus]